MTFTQTTPSIRWHEKKQTKQIFLIIASLIFFFIKLENKNLVQKNINTVLL